MTEEKILSEQEVEELLREPNKVIRKATKQDIVLLKNEFNKLLESQIKSSDKELVELTEGIVDNIDTMEVYVESEDAEGIVFTYFEPKQGDSNDLADSVFISVKF